MSPDSILTSTYDDLLEFLTLMGPEELARRRNYFRWLEYPLAVSMAAPRPGERVLEIGAGFINVIPLWIAARFGVHVTALDRETLTPELKAYVEGLKGRCGVPDARLTVMEGDARHLPFEDGSFDLVLCVSMLEHVPLPGDSEVAAEVGRVLADGGRAIFTFPYNHTGSHIESEEWGGEDYQQRHYNEFTTRSRVIHPSGLWFIKAAIAGEKDPRVGQQYVGWDKGRRREFCEENDGRWRDYWRIYHAFERDEFYLNDGEISDETAQSAGLLALKLEKREVVPTTRYFAYDAFDAYLANDRVLKNPNGEKPNVVIKQVSVTNFMGAPLTHFESGQNIWVRVHLFCEGEVIEPVVRIAFHDSHGRVVSGINAHETGFRFQKLMGDTIINFRMGMLNLVGGRYDLSVGVWDKPRPDPVPPYPYDVHYRMYPVEVRDRYPGMLGFAYNPFQIDVEVVAPKDD